MPHNPDDKRVLFQQVVDDILDQIRDGRLHPNDALPSARKMAEVYGVASMTAQRALRELHNLRVTYSVAGKGTFVHPDAFDVLRGAVLKEPIDDDPGLRQRVADYLAQQRELFARLHSATTAEDSNAALSDLIRHAEEQKALIDEATKYQTAHGNFAQEPEWFQQRADEQPKPRKRTSSRTRKAKPEP
jgi:DNA-binding transcriptional regulator YhcF (GntR family)